MAIKITTGNRGNSLSTECYVELELTSDGGLQICVNSKVQALFGRQITELCNDIFQYYNIENANLYIEDAGALDYILAARLEAAIRQLIASDKEFLPEFLPQNKYQTSKDRPRRSRLYLPGNTPKLALNAGIYGADGIILDLEDSVSPQKKFEAAILVRNTLRALDFYGAERMVRINQLPKGLDDLNFIVPHNVNLILVPKCESAEQIAAVNTRIKKIAEKCEVSNPIHLMPILESAKGIMNALEIAMAENVVALAIGLEDYTADLGVQRTDEGLESLFARTQLVNCAVAAGIQAIDSVFSDISDMDALKKNVQASKALGFDGMGCIHPRQIKVIHDNYAPDEREILTAKRIVNAFHVASEEGLGVVSLGSKMIDPPVVKRAQTTIERAVEAGKLSKNWRDDYDC